jgi:aspartyl-tRNA(Asn)/glutamyl-tRNA(Gln) amidotransferase subunit C
VSLKDDDVKKVARLAALDVDDSELPKMVDQLNSIIGYVDVLSEIPTRGVVPTYHVHGVVNVFRDDVIAPSFEEACLAENAPDFSIGFFRVPQIIKTK